MTSPGPRRDPPERGSSTPLPPDMGPAVRAAAWDALATDPALGLSIVDEEGRTLFANTRAAEFYIGPGAKARDCMEFGWARRLDADAITRRRDFLAKLKQTQAPVVVRTILSGQQVLAMVYPITPDGDEIARFIIVLRPVMGLVIAANLPPGVPLFETDAIDLGPLKVLSPREIEVLALVGQSLSSKEIGKILHRSEKTIENHRYSISKKLAGANAFALAEMARRAGLTVKDATRRRARQPDPSS